jgi:translocator protein
MQINFKVLIICFAVVFLSAFIGSVFTSGNTDSSWYLENKPSITPPNFVFPIVWNILFFLIALSLYFAWMNSTSRQKWKLQLIFGANLISNILWSFLFFSLKNPLLALLDLSFLLATIIFMILFIYRINRVSSYLLIPYLLWVVFAGILNYLWLI